MNDATVKAFLNGLYQPGDEVELVAVKDGKARRKSFEARYLATADGLPILEQFEEQGWNIYVSVLPLACQAEGVYDRVWIDVDEASVEWDDRLPSPTTRVSTSSGRWQAIWKLNKPLDGEDGKSLVRRIAETYGGDTSVHDARRVLRVPGITNAKRGEPTGLLEVADVLTNAGAFDVPDQLAENNVTMEALMATSVNDPKQVLGEWLAGTDEGDRARKAYVTARFLKSCGVSYEDALILVNTGAQRATPPLSEAEVVHSTGSAYNRD